MFPENIPQGVLLEIPRANGGVSKAQIFNGKYEPKLEFPVG